MNIIKPFEVDLPLEEYLKIDFNRRVYNSYHLVDKKIFNCNYNLKSFFDEVYSIIGTLITNYNFELDIINYLDDIFNKKYRLKELKLKEDKFKFIKEIGIIISLCNSFFNDIVVNDILIYKEFFGNRSVYDKMYEVTEKHLWKLYESIDKEVCNIKNIKSKGHLDDYFFQEFIPWSNDGLEISQLQKFLSNTVLSVSDYFTMFNCITTKVENKENLMEIESNNFRKDIFRNQYYSNLFYYLIENYYNPDKGKYSQIYRYLKELNGVICTQSYFIKFIKEIFDVSISKILDQKYNDSLLLKEKHQGFDKSN